MSLQELFCVCGALKRARLVHPGVAEVVFVKKDDAITAYKKYNNRCLDGKWDWAAHSPPRAGCCRPESCLWSGPLGLWQGSAVSHLAGKPRAAHSPAREQLLQGFLPGPFHTSLTYGSRWFCGQGEWQGTLHTELGFK